MTIPQTRGELPVALHVGGRGGRAELHLSAAEPSGGTVQGKQGTSGRNS